MNKGMRHRMRVIMRSIVETLKYRQFYRKCGEVISSKWHRRYISVSFHHIKQLALYMMAIHAGGLRRISLNNSRVLWGMYGWATCGLEKAPARDDGWCPKRRANPSAMICILEI